MKKNSVNKKDLSHDEWLKIRKEGIGGSDAAAVAGLSRWKSPLSVWLDKTGQAEEIEQNERMYWGCVLEDIVAQEFTKRTGKKVRNCNQILYHPEYSFMLANIDRMVVGEDAGLECKTTSDYLSKQWGEDTYPIEYMLQCQHYMAVTGKSKWYLAVLINGCQFKFYEVLREEELLNNLIKIESDFWGLVQKNIMPEADGSDASTDILKKLYPEVRDKVYIELPPGYDDHAVKILEIGKQIKDLEFQKAELENKMKQRIGDYQGGMAGNYRVSWGSFEGTRLDTKRLKAERPEISEEFSLKTVTRKFQIKEMV